MGKSVQELLKEKTSRKELNWGEFNLLENLLVFCLMSGRSVPKETGIAFTVTLDEADSSLCLLFEIDRDRDPLVRDPKTPRPDYLAFHCNNGICIVTIIEMKGGRDTSRALEQIIAFKQILQTEFNMHVPGRFASRVKLQGIVLTSYQQQVPLERIKKEEKRGFVILPLQYNHRAELLPYVSKVNKLTDSGKRIRYRHGGRGRDRGFSPLEAVLVNGVLHTRIRDEILSQNLRSGPGRTGIYLNCARNDGKYCALIAGNDEATIACKSGHQGLVVSIRAELAKIGAQNAFEAKVIE